ncbi:hypothetical protein HJA82_30185 [Rhizobium bangladeshense]|nr:hypothetical protein [Rhizobium bangladeshense]MBX5254372.1 hypothetical protein [Rhizobium sp. NLR4b]MBX5260590.1 hypothetical protein [Rhizobium sp. NLR16b]MBX5266680.1 hypothetical protein [Rhizobium sp. NLR16a]MBX5315189.1 hypothetical protein [Rhizobium sp. NLR11b]
MAHSRRPFVDAHQKMEERPHSAIGNKVPISLMNSLIGTPAELSHN